MTVFAPSLRVQAAALIVPNGSFESPVVPDAPPYVSTLMASWEKNPKPGYFDPSVIGLGWDQTSGVFLDNFVGNPTPIVNREGNQGGFILAFPGAGFHQDYNSSVSHDFDVTLNVGQTYTLTTGFIGKGVLQSGDAIQMNVYYGNYTNGTVINSSYIIFSPAAFADQTNLVDFSVTIPNVQPSDPWAGQKLGISFVDISGIPQGFAYWDLDNTRLSVVPEPCAFTLALLGLAGWLFRPRVRRI